MDPMTTEKPRKGMPPAVALVMGNKELVNRLRNAVAHAPKDADESEHPARQRVEQWLSLLAPAGSSEEKPLSKDLSLVGNVINSIVEAAEEKILTEEEAEAVTQFIISKFIERRLNSTMRSLFVIPKNHWFFAASRYFGNE